MSIGTPRRHRDHYLVLLGIVAGSLLTGLLLPFVIGSRSSSTQTIDAGVGGVNVDRETSRSTGPAGASVGSAVGATSAAPGGTALDDGSALGAATASSATAPANLPPVRVGVAIL